MSSTAPTLDSTTHKGPPSGLFTNRNFMLLWAAYGVSAMGDHISEMALLKARDAMHAPNLTQLQAMITFMFMLPFFVLGPFTGMLADRLPRRAIMIFADLVRVVIMFNFAMLISRFASFGEWGGYLPLMMVGVFAALFSPARSAFLPTLIADDQLVRANAMTSGLGVIATMLSVMIGGYLAEYYPPSVAFHIDAGTFIGSALLLAFIRPPTGEKRRLQHSANGGVAEGVRYIRDHRRVAQLIGIAVVVWLCGATVRSTIPAIVRDVYHLSYSDMGLFQARLGLGMLAGALILTALGDALPSQVAISWSLIGIAGAIATLAFSVLLPLPVRLSYHLGGLAIIFSGVFAAGVMASYNALLQRIIPNRIRGRLFGLIDVVTMAGLLLATGLIGIPEWHNIDQWVGWMLAGVALMVMVTGLWSLLARVHSGSLPAWQRFWLNVNAFYCRWWFRLKREGPLTIPRTGPVLVVANHTSGIDPILLITCSPDRPIGFLIAEEYYDVPVVGFLIRLARCIPVRRGSSDLRAIRAALRHLENGNILGIFPEGRIPKPGETADVKDGAALLAIRSGAVVIPAHISGTRYEANLSRSFLRRQHARVRFGKPIKLDVPPGRADRATLARVTILMQERIAELGRQP